MLAGERLTASVFIVGIVAAPITTNANGTASSGTTETFDTALGYYQATLISGHRYQLTLNGLIGNASVAADVYTLQLRDSGSASNPTSASTLIAQSEWEAPASGSSGRDSIPLQMTFQAASSGVHTFGMSSTRVLGTGAFTPLGTRELFVTDLGGN